MPCVTSIPVTTTSYCDSLPASIELHLAIARAGRVRRIAREQRAGRTRNDGIRAGFERNEHLRGSCSRTRGRRCVDLDNDASGGRVLRRREGRLELDVSRRPIRRVKRRASSPGPESAPTAPGKGERRPCEAEVGFCVRIGRAHAESSRMTARAASRPARSLRSGSTRSCGSSLHANEREATRRGLHRLLRLHDRRTTRCDATTLTTAPPPTHTSIHFRGFFRRP